MGNNESAGWHGNYIETIDADKTLKYSDSGKVFLIGTDGLTISLPATKKGIRYTFVNTGADDAVKVTVDPDDDDAIMGTIASVSMPATDGGALTNTKTGANKGDYASITGDGDEGWFILGGVGVWAGA